MNKIERLKTNKSPKETIYEHFEEILPIKGGWGYTKEDAVIIDSSDVSVNKSEIFNGIAYENKFIKKRLLEELIVAKSFAEDEYAEIKWDKVKQRLIHDNGKSYDCIIVNVSAFLYMDWLILKKEWENNYNNPSFRQEHEQKRQEKIHIFQCEFWFEISSFLGKYNGVIIKNPETGKDEVVEIKIKENIESTQSDNMTLEEKVKVATPLHSINGYKICLIDGIYYIYCKTKNSIGSAIGLNQALSTAETQKIPCFNQAIEKIGGHSVYFIENKFHVCDESEKYLGSTTSMVKAKSIINSNLWDKKFNLTDNKDMKRNEFSIFLSSMGVFIGSLVKLSSFIAIVYFVLFYFNNISNGKYMAQTMAVNSSHIGSGTPESKKYDFILHDNNVLVNKTPYLLDKDKSSFFEKRYFNMFNPNEELLIGSMGSVKIQDKTNNIYKKIKVFYKD